jgi:hypothetical protein
MNRIRSAALRGSQPEKIFYANSNTRGVTRKYSNTHQRQRTHTHTHTRPSQKVGPQKAAASDLDFCLVEAGGKSLGDYCGFCPQHKIAPGPGEFCAVIWRFFLFCGRPAGRRSEILAVHSFLCVGVCFECVCVGVGVFVSLFVCVCACFSVSRHFRASL